MVQGRPFILAHYYKKLENEEKWKNVMCCKCQREIKSTMEARIIDDDESSSKDGKRIHTPNSVEKK